MDIKNCVWSNWKYVCRVLAEQQSSGVLFQSLGTVYVKRDILTIRANCMYPTSGKLASLVSIEGWQRKQLMKAWALLLGSKRAILPSSKGQ